MENIMWSNLGNRKLFIGLVAVLVAVAAVACSSAEPQQAAPAAPSAATATPFPTVVPPSVPVAPAQPAAPSAGGAIERGGHFRLAYSNGFPPKWDFTQTSTWISLAHFGRHYNGLLQFSPRDGTEVWPDMATKWEITNDSKTYTFTIDENLTQWHDGTPIDIDQIIFGLDRWRNPPEGVIQPRVGALALIDNMKKIDDTTLEINLSEPFGDFIATSANAWHLILPQHIMEANNGTVPSAELTIGTGPFMFESAEDGVSMTSQMNPNYFRKDPNGDPYPYLDRVTSIEIPEKEAAMAAARTKQLDALKQVPQAVLDMKKLAADNAGQATFQVEPFVDVASIQLNNTKPPFDNIAARRAVFYGMNKKRIIDFNGEEQPVNPISWMSNLFPPTAEVLKYPGYNDATRADDVAKARAWAKEAGLTEFELISVPFRVQDAELLAQDMDDIGVKVTIVERDWPTMIASVEGRNYDAATGGTAPSYAGPIPVIDIMYTPGGGRNGGWDAPQDWLDAWNQARRLQPGADRDAQLRIMEDIMLNDWVPTVPYYGVSAYKFWWNYLHNYGVIAQDIFNGNKFEDLWLDSNAPTK